MGRHRYVLADAIVKPLNGWLTALFGRKWFYATSLAVFMARSLPCGPSHNVRALVFFGASCEVGDGPLQPIARTILFESYTPDTHGCATTIAISTWTR